jgi:hypothetical protein
VTAPLALGCESAGRIAENEAPASENPGRTEQTFETISPHQGTTAKLDQRGVAGAYGRIRAISSARTIGLRKTGPGRGSAPRMPLTLMKSPPDVIEAHSGHKGVAVSVRCVRHP